MGRSACEMRINLHYIWTILFMVLATTAFATEKSVQQICRTINTGDIKGLELMFDSQLELSMLGESVVCNKDYAMQKISDFIGNILLPLARFHIMEKEENLVFVLLAFFFRGVRIVYMPLLEKI